MFYEGFTWHFELIRMLSPSAEWINWTLFCYHIFTLLNFSSFFTNVQTCVNPVSGLFDSS